MSECYSSIHYSSAFKNTSFISNDNEAAYREEVEQLENSLEYAKILFVDLKPAFSTVLSVLDTRFTQSKLTNSELL